jgi:deoxyribodipyrimidine photolyase
VSTSIVLFNRDLRVGDNPALTAAAKAERTVPLFVLDPALLESRFAALNRVFNPIARPTASTPTATTCAATCPNWRRSRARPCPSLGASTPSSDALDYPEPIVDHDDAVAAFIARRT